MSKKKIKPRAQEVNRYVGARIRERRITLGLTQQEMAKLIGVTYQQAHKYEHGINRVSAGRLYDIAQALNVSVGYFFEQFEDAEDLEMAPRRRLRLGLARNFGKIANQRHQEALSFLARALSQE